jgi:hypothetical protein
MVDCLTRAEGLVDSACRHDCQGSHGDHGAAAEHRRDAIRDCAVRPRWERGVEKRLRTAGGLIDRGGEDLEEDPEVRKILTRSTR